MAAVWQYKRLLIGLLHHLLSSMVLFHLPASAARPSFRRLRRQLLPLIIGIIGVLASAFLLICYYTVVSRYCNRARRRRAAGSAAPELPADGDVWRISTRGLDEAAIKSIAVHQYRRGGLLADATDCSVCLSEFVVEEKVRLLPKCGHAFHVQCIDTWLKSHSNCPLCRANILQPAPPPPPPPPLLLPPPPPPLPPPSPTGHDRAMSDLEMELGQGVVQPMRRSVSMDAICQGRVLTMDNVVRNDVEEELGRRWEERSGMMRSASSSSGRFNRFGGRSCC